MKPKSKSTLTPKRRFPEFRDKPGWEESTVGELATTVAPPKKLTTSQYFPEGRFPIVDQSPDDQCGWTNDDNALIKNSLPLIVFGDHTCVLKLVNQPFAQGADGIKIFRPKRSVSTEYLYHFLCARPLVMESYKRHFSILKGRQVFYPEGEAEQQKIAECLSSLDGLIAAEGRKLAALRGHKRGLMQQLFPQPGETQPLFRFPEFRDKGRWEEKVLSDACLMQAGKFVPASDIREQDEDGLYPCYGGNGLRGFTKSRTHDGIHPLIGRQGALCGNVRLALGEFYATEHAVVASPRKGVDVIWLFYMLDQLNLNRFATGQAQPGLSVDVLEKVNLVVPALEKEQRRIADCLTTLDNLIAAQAAKIDVLKQHKRGLMQQLFPAPEVS